MTETTRDFRDVLEADARRRAGGASISVHSGGDGGDHGASADLRFRLVNTFPRQTRPLFAALRATLEPYGYTLSPLHPAPDLPRPRMQTELTRIAVDDPARYAPLVFELEPPDSSLRVYVRQFGGRAAPDFAERRFDLAAAQDLPAMEALLKDYVRCMLAAPQAAAA